MYAIDNVVKPCDNRTFDPKISSSQAGLRDNDAVKQAHEFEEPPPSFDDAMHHLTDQGRGSYVAMVSIGKGNANVTNDFCILFVSTCFTTSST